MSEKLSRRDVLLRGGLATAGIGAVLYPGMALAVRRPTAGVAYRLCVTDQCSCRACQGHAENKLFATRAAAEHGRAHPGCRCAVVREGSIGDGPWVDLFGSASELHRTGVDRRWASTQRALGRPSGFPLRSASTGRQQA